MEPITLITEVKPPFASQNTGEQHQRPPFTQGQLLLATVIAKGETQLATLNINGHHITAESSIPLRIGQQLDLQVMSLTPRMELQVASPEPANRWMGNALPLLGKEPFLLPQLAALADDTGLMAQLRPEAQATLLLFAGRQHAGSSPPPFPVPAIINQLADLLVQKTLPTSEANIPIPQQDIAALLQSGGRTASLDPQTAAELSRLAELFSRGLADQQFSAPGQSTVLSKLATATPKDPGVILEFLTTLAGLAVTDSALPAQLLSLHQAYGSLPAQHPLRQLLAFLIQTTSTHTLPFLAQNAGEHLSERLSRLGLNMERLLAGDKPDAATHTLKFALLELAQRAEAATGKSGAAPGQLVQLLELYQLVQHRLANESLVFLPLPFLFLQQGYALVENDRSDNEAETADKRSSRTKTVVLHLRLEGLGNLQIDIRRQEDALTLRFLAEDVGKAQFIAGFRQELEQWLTSGKLESVQFLIGAREPIKSLLEKITSGGTGMIDTKA